MSSRLPRQSSWEDLSALENQEARLLCSPQVQQDSAYPLPPSQAACPEKSAHYQGSEPGRLASNVLSVLCYCVVQVCGADWQ